MAGLALEGERAMRAAQRLSDSGLRALPTRERNFRTAAKPGWKFLRFAAGFLIGSSVPLACYWMAHHEVVMPAFDEGYRLVSQPSAWVVLACLVFSAPTVARWGAVAFGAPYKGVALAVIWELVMVTSTTVWLRLGILSLLLAANAVACGWEFSRRRGIAS
jgi:hypothetical protein